MLKKSKVEYVASRFGDEHFKLRQDSFEKIFDEIHPSIVFLDSFIGNDFIPLYKHLVNRNVKLNFINTMAIFEDKGLPALNSPLVPDQKLKIIIDKLKNRILVSWHKILETIALIGNSSDRIVQRQIRISKIPEYHRPLTNGSLGTTYSKIPELVLGIKEFEFKMLDTPDRHYIGFRPSLKRYEFIKVDQITRLKQVVQASDKIVYISFGTLYSNTKKELLRLIEIIFNYANEVPNISFIFSNMSKSIIEKIALETPSNVFLFGFIPQTAVLSKSDIFITHGGMNSIRESIHSTVPMLVFPIKDGYDQIGNAARVAFHKLGLAGHLHNISKARLGEMIMELINTPMYKENLERFKIRSESQ
ncbi:MAG TPA: glycosyltransferase, partial [Cyclobacteriaceae bacterium]|nr:glycosyltransferase [Cyclobacteriaceae bacterium]